MTKKDKIIACYGNVRPKSIAIMCETSQAYVNSVIYLYCINPKSKIYEVDN